MKVWIGPVALVIAGTVAYGLAGQTRREENFTGALPVGRIEQIFGMPGGFTALGKVGDPRRYSDIREERFIPNYYGDLVTVTVQADLAVLWYRDNTGVIRNVPLPDPAHRLYHLEPQGATIRQTNH